MVVDQPPLVWFSVSLERIFSIAETLVVFVDGVGRQDSTVSPSTWRVVSWIGFGFLLVRFCEIGVVNDGLGNTAVGVP